MKPCILVEIYQCFGDLGSSESRWGAASSSKMVVNVHHVTWHHVILFLGTAARTSYLTHILTLCYYATKLINCLTYKLNGLFLSVLQFSQSDHYSRTQIIKSLNLTLGLLMSYIYMEHLFLMFLDHTQRCRTVSRTPLDE